MKRALLIVLGNRDDVEQIFTALLPDDARGGARRHRRVLVALKNIRHRVGDARGVGTHGEVDFVLGDQFLKKLDALLLVRFVIKNGQIDFLADPTALGILLFNIHFPGVHEPAGGLGVTARLRYGDAYRDLSSRPDIAGPGNQYGQRRGHHHL